MVRFLGLMTAGLLAIALVGCGSQQSTSESSARMQLATGDSIDGLGENASPTMMASRCDTVAADVERSGLLTASQKEVLEKTLQHPDTNAQMTARPILEAAVKFDKGSHAYIQKLLRDQKAAALPTDKFLWDEVYSSLFPGQTLKEMTKEEVAKRDVSEPTMPASESNEPAAEASNQPAPTQP